MQRTAIVVDDSRVARMTLKKLLVAADFNVTEFGSGEEVIEYLQSASSESPDIIFMDVMMGGMDGLTATKKIKEDPKLKAIPVIMCTGNDTQDDHDKAVEAGAVTALSKPPESKALATVLDAISLHVDETEAVAEPAASFDEEAFITKILSAVELQWLPTLENRIDNNVHNVVDNLSPDVYKDVVNALINEQLEQKQASVDTRIRAVAESVSQEIIKDSTTKMIDDRLANFAPASEQPSLEQFTESIEVVVAEQAQIASKVAEETMLDSAAKSVQAVVAEADLPAQINEFFAERGEEWLTEQEEELGSQLTAQLDALIPSLVSEKLAETLPLAIKEQIGDLEQPNKDTELDQQDVDSVINSALHRHTTSVFQPLISATINKRFSETKVVSIEELNGLKQDINVLKKISIGLGVAVIGLLIAAIF